MQRAVFDGLAACLPELRAGGAQLGRPLSEDPEFWRAAPDAECVDWVAEELGLPPGRWDRSSASQGPPVGAAAEVGGDSPGGGATRGGLARGGAAAGGAVTPRAPAWEAPRGGDDGGDAVGG